MKLVAFAFLIGLFFLFLPQMAFASEIIAVPETDTFGPNDWIKIPVKIDGYSGGALYWNATKPDGSIETGVFQNLQASKVVHTINRNAFDNQFGNWTVVYQYKNLTKSIDVNVKPLTLTVKTDKQTYFPGDAINVDFSTNYFEPSAAKAQSISINVVDQNGKSATLIDEITIKVYQPSFSQKYFVDDFLKYNPAGTYHAIAKYYNIEVDIPFTISDTNSKLSVFLGSDKDVYDPGDSVELNFVISKPSTPSGLLTVTFPSGKTMTKTIPISGSLTRTHLDGITSSEIGTFKYEFEYGGSRFSKTFDVFTESLDHPALVDLAMDVSVEKSQYRPGELININVTANKLTENQVTYWLEDSLANQGDKLTFEKPTSKKFVIPYTIPRDSSEGPWKVYVKYGQTEAFAIFIIAGNAVTPAESDAMFPNWIRNNAKWWNENKITDNDFATGIEYMIKEKIIHIPESAKNEIVSEKQIPPWIKNSANWWADGLVSDQEFANAIQYLINAGIIQV